MHSIGYFANRTIHHFYIELLKRRNYAKVKRIIKYNWRDFANVPLCMLHPLRILTDRCYSENTPRDRDDKHLEVLEYFFTVVEQNLPDEAERKQFLASFLKVPEGIMYLNARYLKCIMQHFSIEMESFTQIHWKMSMVTLNLFYAYVYPGITEKENLETLEYILSLYPSVVSDLLAWESFTRHFERASVELREKVTCILVPAIEQCSLTVYPECLVPYLQKTKTDCIVKT